MITKDHHQEQRQMCSYSKQVLFVVEKSFFCTKKRFCLYKKKVLFVIEKKRFLSEGEGDGLLFTLTTTLTHPTLTLN
jgi:hypothetical protein